MKSVFRQFAAFSGISVVVILAGCATTKDDRPPVPPEQRDLAVQEGYYYEIAPGDTLEIFVWGRDELSGEVTVRPDGMITTRLVEDLPASGKTPSQLARDLEKNYATYVKVPIVTVLVNEFVGLPSQQVRVVGEATNPASIPFQKHMTLLDLMIAVGGLTDFAAGNNSVLIRYTDGEQHQYGVRLEDLVRDGDISANVSLLPGDVLIIPEAWF